MHECVCVCVLADYDVALERCILSDLPSPPRRQLLFAAEPYLPRDAMREAVQAVGRRASLCHSRDGYIKLFSWPGSSIILIFNNICPCCMVAARIIRI